MLRPSESENKEVMKMHRAKAVSLQVCLLLIRNMISAVGKPQFDMKYHVVDDDGNDVPDGFL